MLIHLAPIHLSDIADRAVVARITAEGAVAQRVVLLRLQIGLRVDTVVHLLESDKALHTQLRLILLDDRAAGTHIELLDGLVLHIPFVTDVDEADKVAVGLARADLVAIICRDPDGQMGVLFLFEDTHSHLDHHRRENGVRRTVDPRRVIHEILGRDLDLIVIALADKRIEQIFERSPEREIGITAVIAIDRLVLGERIHIGEEILAVRDGRIGELEILGRGKLAVLFDHILIQGCLEPEHAAERTADGVREIEPDTVVSVGERHQMTVDLFTAQDQSCVLFGQYGDGSDVMGQGVVLPLVQADLYAEIRKSFDRLLRRLVQQFGVDGSVELYLEPNGKGQLLHILIQ